MDHPNWVWQHADWPHFHWQPDRLAALLRECGQAQGKLLDMLGSVSQPVSQSAHRMNWMRCCKIS